MTGGSRDPMRRLERLDVAFTRYNSEKSLLEADAALEERRFGAATGIRDRARPHTYYYNRVLGLGAGAAGELDAVVAWYAEAGIRAGLTTTPDQLDDPLLAAIGARGFRVIATDCFFWLELAGHAPAPGPEHIAIRRAGPGDLDTVYSIFLADEPDPPVSEATRRRRGPAHMRPEFPIYLAFIDGEAVAMASMFVHDGLAFLGNANTLERARGRGCQRALIEHRLGAAAAMGCDAAASDTRFGTTSHRNVERAGMRLLFQSLSWQLPATE